MIAKNPAIPNKKSWFRGFLSRLKVFFSSPPPELDESHAETRYRIARMTREEWEEYERAMFDEACEKGDYLFLKGGEMNKTCKTCYWNSDGRCCAPVPEWVFGLIEEYDNANLAGEYKDCEVHKKKRIASGKDGGV